MEPISVTAAQLRRYLLDWHGLLGAHQFQGRVGVVDVVSRLGAVQFDPVNVCGRSADLVFAARVADYRLADLDHLLYQSRELIDYFDKCLCIVPVVQWPSFSVTRDRAREYYRETLEPHGPVVLDQLANRGPLSSQELELPGRIDWHWSEASLAKAVLESLFRAGEIGIHHKVGTRRYFDLSHHLIPGEVLEQSNPNETPQAQIEWAILRRIRAVGALWNRPSDAFLGATESAWGSPKAAVRKAAFVALAERDAIVPVAVPGLPDLLWLPWENQERLAAAADLQPGERLELLAPLDSLLWDRKLVAALWGFDYTWEIYTPAVKRRFAAYALPILDGERLVGRIAPRINRGEGVLEVLSLWLESDAVLDRDRLRATLARHAALHGLRLGPVPRPRKTPLPRW